MPLAALVPSWAQLAGGAAGALQGMSGAYSSCSSAAVLFLLLTGVGLGWCCGCAWGWILRSLAGQLDRRVVRRLLRAGAQLLSSVLETPTQNAAERLREYGGR